MSLLFIFPSRRFIRRRRRQEITLPIILAHFGSGDFLVVAVPNVLVGARSGRFVVFGVVALSNGVADLGLGFFGIVLAGACFGLHFVVVIMRLKPQLISRSIRYPRGYLIIPRPWPRIPITLLTGIFAN